MKSKHQSLLVFGRDDRLVALQFVLDGMSVGTTRARSRVEAEKILCQTPPPHVVLTDTVLSDGNWTDVLDLAAKAREKVNVIVVSPHGDIDLYLDAMNYGAFDFITGSFTVPEIVDVIQAAIDDSLRSRTSSPGVSIPSRQIPPSPQETLA